MRSSGASGGPGIRAATLALVAALCAGALAVFAPIPGIALAVVLVGAVVLWRATLPDLGRIAVLVAMVAAIIGPNLAVPGAQEAFAFRFVAGLIVVGIAVWLLMGRGLPVPDGLGWPVALAAGGLGPVEVQRRLRIRCPMRTMRAMAVGTDRRVHDP